VTAAHLIRTYLEPLMIGEDPTAIERLTARLRRGVAANPFTKAGLEIALWDILLAEPLPIEAGSARPFERPGLGVDLDEAKLRRYRVG
jgi:muconate cycloisomerase